MNNNVNVSGDARQRGVNLSSDSNVGRASPRTDFGTHLRNGVAAGANVASGAISVAAPMIPGGAVLSAAASGVAGGMGGGTGSYGSGAPAGTQFGGADNIPVGGSYLNTQTGGAGGGAAGGGGVPGSQQDLLNQTKGMQEMAQSFNLQYLQLQEKMQSENRSFSTVSNVMKTKHDTAKSSISNVR
jgi:hypothetical protein